MPDQAESRSPPAALGWLLIPNAGWIVLLLVNAPWPMASLLYCGGNGLWIAWSLRGRVAGTREEEGLAHSWGPCLVMTVGALCWAWAGQPVGTVNDGLAWDGRHYAGIYSYFASGTFVPIAPEFPYSQRIGLPYLAAQLPLTARHAFLLLHAVFWSGTMVLFAICCRVCFDLRASSIQFGVLWLQVLWLSVPRGTASYAFTVDPAALFFIQAWVFLLLWGRWRWLLPVCAFVGVLFKETVLLIVLLSFLALVVVRLTRRFIHAPPVDRSAPRFSTVAVLALAGVAACAAKWMASEVLPLHHPVRSTEWGTMLHWLSLRVQDPSQLLRYPAAVFSAYGGFALLRVATIGKPGRNENRRAVAFATALCPLYLAVCFVAGSDLSKFAYMAFPFALPILLNSFEEVPPAFALLALLLGLPAAHAFTPIPSPIQDYPALDLRGLYSWMMEYAHPAIVGSWIAWWLGCVLLLRSTGFSSTWRTELSP